MAFKRELQNLYCIIFVFFTVNIAVTYGELDAIDVMNKKHPEKDIKFNEKNAAEFLLRYIELEIEGKSSDDIAKILKQEGFGPAGRKSLIKDKKTDIKIPFDYELSDEIQRTLLSTKDLSRLRDIVLLNFGNSVRSVSEEINVRKTNKEDLGLIGKYLDSVANVITIFTDEISSDEIADKILPKLHNVMEEAEKLNFINLLKSCHIIKYVLEDIAKHGEKEFLCNTAQVLITCNKCDIEFLSEIFTIINATEYPHFINSLIDNKLNYKMCPFCGFAGFIPFPYLIIYTVNIETIELYYHFPFEKREVISHIQKIPIEKFTSFKLKLSEKTRQEFNKKMVVTKEIKDVKDIRALIGPDTEQKTVQIRLGRSVFVPIFNYIGTVYYHSKNYDVAETFFRKTLKYDPSNMDGHYNLGSVLYEMGRLDDAAREYEIHSKILETETLEIPKWTEPVTLFSKDISRKIHALESKSGQLSSEEQEVMLNEAYNDLQKFLHDYPNDLMGYFELGIVSHVLGKRETALNSLAKLNLLAPNHEVVRGLEMILAMDELEELRKDEENTATSEKRAKYLKKYKEIKAHVEKHPNDPVGYCKLFMISSKLERNKEALGYLAKLKELLPDNIVTKILESIATIKETEEKHK